VLANEMRQLTAQRAVLADGELGVDAGMPVGSSEREAPWRMPVHHAHNVGMSTTMSDRMAGASVLARVVSVGAVAERVRDHATARPA
jgi:hypothetical protein